nr:gas vesicle protein GvpG [Anabaena sp. 90]
MLTKLLLLPIMGPLNGVVWIAEQIQERTNTEFECPHYQKPVKINLTDY